VSSPAGVFNMAKKSILDLVQNILVSLDGDEVTSIGDTIESEQVSQIVREVYEDILVEFEIPGRANMFKLDATGTTTPTEMVLPSTSLQIDWIKYDRRKELSDNAAYTKIRYMDIETFMTYILDRNSNDLNTEALQSTSGDVDLLVFNDKAPVYWTSFDDNTITFDSYDKALETNLQTSKTSCFGKDEGSLVLIDETIPALPSQYFPYLQDEAKSRAFSYMKQTTNPKVNRMVRQHRLALQRTRDRVNEHKPSVGKVSLSGRGRGRHTTHTRGSYYGRS